MERVRIIGLILGVSAGASAWSQPKQYDFSDIWEQASKESPELLAADHESQAAMIGASRSARHWYPRLFVEGRVYSTSDPAMNFMSLLNQRQVSAADFASGLLNQPGSNIYEHGSLGLDLPLFEGGSKVAAAQSARSISEARRLELKATRIKLYAELAGYYASILALQKQASDLTRLSEGVDQVLSSYRVGAKSNPVGYSGLLGLKNLRNRLEGLRVGNSAQLDGLRERVRALVPNLPAEWNPKREDPSEFVSRSLGAKTVEGQSLSVRAMEDIAASIEKGKTVEQARFLPRIGLFASGDLYAGNRGVATGYTGGVYLQWDLISASNWGALDEAEHRVAAARARAESEAQKVVAANAVTRKSIESLEKNLKLMRESTRFLEEQTATTRTLFRNGSINALQLVEVLSRRADLMVSLTETELGWSQARANLLLGSGAEEVMYEN